MDQDEDPKGSRKQAIPRTVVMGQRLWRQAERDLENAVGNLRPNGWYVSANLAHQAAEKSLKAACWHLRAQEPPWIHDLDKCADLVAEAAGGIPTEVELAIDQLEPLFEESRYPSSNADEPIPADLIGEADARDALESAEKVMAWVRSLLLRPAGKTRRGKTS